MDICNNCIHKYVCYYIDLYGSDLLPEGNCIHFQANQKRGHWIKDNNKRTCSECGYYYFSNDVNAKYCAECGTAMFDKLEILTKG